MPAPFRAQKPTLTIDGTDFHCMIDELPEFEAEEVGFCVENAIWNVSVPVILSYGATGSYRTLKDLEGTIVTCVFAPVNAGAASEDNPQQTFTARIPIIPPAVGGARGDTVMFDLELEVHGALTEAVA